jgi:hypothetical protein
MNSIGMAVIGWLLPGGAYLLTRRYLQFAIFAVAVTASFAAGMATHGSSLWPTTAELAGLDGFTALAFQASALAKILAGGPYVIARLFDSPSFLSGRMHEYGTTLLILAGLINLLAVSSAIDLRKEEAR